MKTTEVDQKTGVSKGIPMSGKYNPQVAKPGYLKKDTVQSKGTQKDKLTQAMISQRARMIWEQSGRVPGRDEKNWLEAERQLRAELGIS